MSFLTTVYLCAYNVGTEIFEPILIESNQINGVLPTHIHDFENNKKAIRVKHY